CDIQHIQYFPTRRSSDLLNQTWKKYQKNIEQIQDWEPDKGKTDMFLKEIKTLLGCTKDIPFVLLFFVGTFNNNAFVAPYNESKMMLCLPIEQQISDIVDRKSTRLNSSHVSISYAVFCLKKK